MFSCTLHFATEHEQPTIFGQPLMQVGDVDRDHSECMRAELDKQMPRPVLIVDSKHPGADAFAIASCAFASSSMALKAAGGDHAELADTCLQHAQIMYQHAGPMATGYCDSLPICAKTYKAEQWEQYMFFAAAWLYRATGQAGFKKVWLHLCRNRMPSISAVAHDCTRNAVLQVVCALICVQTYVCRHMHTCISVVRSSDADHIGCRMPKCGKKHQATRSGGQTTAGVLWPFDVSLLSSSQPADL